MKATALLALSLCVSGLSPDDGAEGSTVAGDIPPIFAPKEQMAIAASHVEDIQPTPAPLRESTTAILQQISEGLPKFDSRMAQKDSGQADSSADPEHSGPVLMEPFSVFDARVLELKRPHEDLLQKLIRAEPLYRHVGRKMTSELTFVDLAQASNWGPFSVQAPLAVSLRFTLSW